MRTDLARVTHAIIGHDLRRHLGRWHFRLAVVALAVLVHLLWIAPEDGATMLRVGSASAAPNSAMLALAYGSELPLWIGLFGFIVVRGQVRQDWTSGLGAIVAALPVGNLGLLFGRWLAAVLAVSMLSLASLAAVLVLHSRQLNWQQVPAEAAAYLQAWCWLGTPAILFAASMAVLCDAWAALIGRLGDLLFFALWFMSAFAMEPFWRGAAAASNPLLLLDFAGHYSAAVQLTQLFGTVDISLGGRSSVEPGLAFVQLPDTFWTMALIQQRALCALLALIPLVLAASVFHRYSNDRLRGSGNFMAAERDGPGVMTRLGAARAVPWQRLLAAFGQFNAPLDLLNRLLTPLLRLVRPLFGLASRLSTSSGLAGQVVAEMALTLAVSPAIMLLLPACWLLGLTAFGGTGDESAPGGGGPLLICLVLWGCAISTVSTREHEDGWSPLSACAPGGTWRRHWRQLLAALLFGVAFSATFLLARLLRDPVAALALLAVLTAVAAAATLLGRLAGVPRPFLFLLLLGALILDRLSELPALDWLGSRHPVSTAMLVTELAVAAGLAMAGYFIQLAVRHRT
ncbi:hypothetical protein RQP53_17675 [Paucibacter sp. APW11]|uniref:ABC transporter permease n=1 Tax=Roseateles aquae TaxID=3077235 RepID=A0ABU3PF11_9BURK|nr:hypothetical protein [Paucibacter sp. APW11]MDT9001113.1 hypothetical protein [Paucibacter sp. APW11]